MTPRLITLSSEQRSAAGRDDDAGFERCETVRRGILTPRIVRRRAHDWRGLDRDEPSTDVSIVVPGAQASRFRYRPSAAELRAVRRTTRIHPRDRDRSYVRPVTGSRAHDPKRLPSSQLLRARTPLVSKPPTPYPRAFETAAFWASTPRDPRAFARRPGGTCHLWDGSVFALHRFTRSRRTATVRGVSVKLLRARSRVSGVPSGYRAPRPRCIRPTSTHPSSRPREPVPSCDPSVDTMACAAVLTDSPRGLGGTVGRLTVPRTLLLAEP